MESLEHVLSVEIHQPYFYRKPDLDVQVELEHQVALNTHGMNYIGLKEQKMVKLEVVLHLV